MMGIHEERSRSAETPYIKAIRMILVFMILGTALCVEANSSVPDRSENVMITEIYYDTNRRSNRDWWLADNRF
jgi:hypothetical protein